MYEWYIKKLNEFIGVAQYCRHQVIEAHLVLARSATEDCLSGEDRQSKAALQRVIRLSAEQAMREGLDATAEHLLAAADTLETESKKTADIIALHFADFSSATAQNAP
ncbi:MAG: hypothetical protein MK042_13525 [Cognatishimia sp.]|nr:hypothetical protein [Cognatishimia sp.]